VEFLCRNRGRHRMCLVGGGDWNDALEIGGKRGRGESVWLTVAVCRSLRYTAEIARHIGQTREADKFERWRRELARDINRYAWDGNWYIYGFADNGQPVGTARDAEGAIYANVQTWALMEGIVPAGRTAKVWKSIENYLYTDVGVLVLHPPYAAYRPEIGRLSSMATGTYEHASAYAHGTAFLVAAYAANKMGRKAVECWHRVHPSNPLNPHSGCEPYGCTTFYTGPSSMHFGQSLNSWFTGSVAWTYFQAMEGILGVKPEFGGLRIDPAIPPTWSRYEVVRKFRGATYCIQVRNPDHVESGVRRITVDGRPIRGTLVRAQPGTHEVEVRM
jgi:cellobiose phosphorylase